MATGGMQRDPVSELFDNGARALLTRAYAAPAGTWVGTRLADPSPKARAFAAERGINVDAPDAPSTPGGRGLDCRTRWARAFVRALYHQHLWYSPRARGGPWQRRLTRRSSGPLQVEVGRAVTDRLGAGRAVRIRIHPGGQQAADRAVARMSDDQRLYADGGQLGRASDPRLRDW